MIGSCWFMCYRAKLLKIILINIYWNDCIYKPDQYRVAEGCSKAINVVNTIDKV